jgi:hypothetical protein
MSQKTYELTRQVLAEEIDAEENPMGTTETFNPGTRFTIIHEPHAWGITRTEHCTVQVKGRLYNILGRVLNASMREVESLG